MTTVRRWPLLLTCFVVTPIAATAAVQEHVGTWVISCPDEAPCQMRFAKRFLDKSGITGDLEIEAQGNTLVPVLALHGLPNEAVAAATLLGKSEAWLQFAGGAREALDCAASETGYVCAPNEAAGSRLAAQLPTARDVTVHIAVAVSGMPSLPAREKLLALAGTNEALVRLRAARPMPVPSLKTALASPSPAGLMGAVDRALKAAGHPGGISRLQSLMAKYMRQ